MTLLALLFVTAAGIQILYLLTFAIVFARHKQPVAGDPLPVSIIVCAHDEEENLRELVPLLVNQDHPAFEVIIVEDRCNDGTYDYLREAAVQYTNLRTVRVQYKPDHIGGKKFALTLGIKAARYEHLLFTDADCRPASQWARTVSSYYTTGTDIILGFSPYTKTAGWLNSFIRFEALLTAIQYMSLAWLGKPYMGVGRNLSYKKTKFFSGKGFGDHQHLLGGDDDLFVNEHATSANTVAITSKDSIVYSIPSGNLADFLHQKLRHLSVGKYYRMADKICLGVFMLTWLITWLLLLPAWQVEPLPGIVPAVFLLRWIVLIVLYRIASRKLQEDFEMWKIPALDFIFAFYYLVTGLRALVAKRLRWKN